jgi:hypothetical protein
LSADDGSLSRVLGGVDVEDGDRSPMRGWSEPMELGSLGVTPHRGGDLTRGEAALDEQVQGDEVDGDRTDGLQALVPGMLGAIRVDHEAVLRRHGELAVVASEHLPEDRPATGGGADVTVGRARFG